MLALEQEWDKIVCIASKGSDCSIAGASPACHASEKELALGRWDRLPSVKTTPVSRGAGIGCYISGPGKRLD